MSGREVDAAEPRRSESGRLRTVVLDDDPTGTQSVSGVQVLLQWDGVSIADAVAAEGAVYLQTNSRAISAHEAVILAERIRAEIADAEAVLGERILVVLRGDSTLRGHVFAESEVFAGDVGRILFVPAFPAGGRTTIGSVHYVRIGDQAVPAAETEFAKDPVFGYRHSDLVEWTREVGKRRAIPVSLELLRSSGGSAVAGALRVAAPGEVVVPDAESDDDIRLIHSGLLSAIAEQTPVVVRCGAPLAAICAGHMSPHLLARPISVPDPGAVLVVCGSHTGAAGAQLAELVGHLGAHVFEIPTDAARSGPEAAGHAVADRARTTLEANGIAVIATERTRRAEHDTLADGELVMRALMTATRELAAGVGAIVSKGGITSAEVASTGFGVDRAFVRGQIAPGISVWDLSIHGSPRVQVVVPGNVGEARTLVDVVSAMDHRGRKRA